MRCWQKCQQLRAPVFFWVFSQKTTGCRLPSQSRGADYPLSRGVPTTHLVATCGAGCPLSRDPVPAAISAATCGAGCPLSRDLVPAAFSAATCGASCPLSCDLKLTTAKTSVLFQNPKGQNSREFLENGFLLPPRVFLEAVSYTHLTLPTSVTV